MINRNNYEEYFLLYTDNELTEEERNAVKEFVDENPDLHGELMMLQQLRIKPEQDIFFGGKDELFRGTEENSVINHNNSQEYFLLYADNELNADARKMVEEFVGDNQELRQEFELILITQVGPDNNIVFPGKEILFRKSPGRAVFVPWMQIAAAAAVLMLVGLFVFNNSGKSSVQQATKMDGNKTTANNLAENKGNIEKIHPVVTSASGNSFNLLDINNKMLATNKTGKKMNERENRHILVKQDQQSDTVAALQLVDSSSETIIAPRVNRDIQKVYDEKKEEIVPPSINSSAANLAAIALTDNVIDADNAPDGDDKLYIAGTSTKKNKFRGFFRKVSRAFNKTAHVDNDNNDAILIGSFRIALK